MRVNKANQKQTIVVTQVKKKSFFTHLGIGQCRTMHLRLEHHWVADNILPAKGMQSHLTPPVGRKISILSEKIARTIFPLPSS